MEKIKLYEFSIARSVRCHWMLKELGVEFESVSVNLRAGEQKAPEYLKIHPLGRVPALVDGDLTLFESAAICYYLAAKHPEKRMLPQEGTKERAIHDQWVFFGVNEIEGPLWVYEKNSWRYPEEKRSESNREMAAQEIKEACEVMNRELQGKSFLIGNELTVSDILLSHILGWAKMRSLCEGLSEISRYLEGLQSREHFPRHLYKK